MKKGRPNKNENGSLYYDKSAKSWRCWYYIVNPTNLKKERKSKSFKTEQEAKDYISTLEYQKEDILYTDNNGIPLNLLIKSNIERKFDLGIIAGNQYNRLNRTLATIEKWSSARKNIDELTSNEIQAYLNSLRNYSNSYITKIHELIYTAFNNAQKKGYIIKNPMTDVIRPKSNKDDKEVRAMTIEEQQAFTNYLMSMPISLEPYKNVFLFQMFLGLRIGEALALKKTDINLQKNIVSVRRTLTVDKDRNLIVGNKTKTYCGKRDVPIPEFIRDSVIEQMKESDNNKDNLLFTSKNDTLVFTNNVNYRLKRILKAMGIEDISSHSLRHTFGTRCIEARYESCCSSKITWS
jgi:integrase